MPYIMNALDDVVSTQAHGKWFSWKPQEIKVIHNENLAAFLRENRGEEGLVGVSEEIMEMDKNTEAYKTAIYNLRKAGIQSFVSKQNQIIQNLEISLRGDYEKTGLKGNFLFEASKGELEAYKRLKKYRAFETAEQTNTADEIQQLRQELYGDGSSRPSPSEGAAEVINPLKK